MTGMNRGLNAATKRWGVLNRVELEVFVGNLKKLTSNLETMCGSLPTSGRVKIDGATKGQRAFELLQEYANCVNDAVTN
jgi:hypothetical protein